MSHQPSYDFKLEPDGVGWRVLLYRSGFLHYTRRMWSREEALFFARQFVQSERFRKAVRDGTEMMVDRR